MSRIVIIQFSSNLDGSSFSGLMLANGLKEAGWETHMAFAHDGPIINKYRKAGHKVDILPHKNWLRSGHPVRFLRNLKNEIRASDKIKSYLSTVSPDMIYLNTAASFAGAYAAHKLGLKMIWHIRELSGKVGGEMHIPFLFSRKIKHVFSDWPEQVIVNSLAVAEDMLGSNKEGIEIVPNAVDKAFFEEGRSQIDGTSAI